MKYFSEYKNKLAVICVIILLVTLFQFYTFAASGTIYESEDNGSFSTADVTYDDYDNYGTIGSSSDYDYWKYTATYTGFANIWLGNIPSGCNYNLYMYNGSQAYMAVSMQSTGTQEIIRARVVSGQTYYIRVNTTYYSSTQNYLLRIKNNSLGYARMFTYDYYKDNGEHLYTIPSGTNAMPYIWNMGYSGQAYPNNAASSVQDAMASSRIFVINTHSPTVGGSVECYSAALNDKSLLLAEMPAEFDTYGSVIEAGNLSDVRIAIFAACKTGIRSDTFGDFIPQTLSQGASCVIGWKNNIYVGGANRWLERFFLYCSQGMNVSAAMQAADDYMITYEFQLSTNINSREIGTSRPASIIL